MIGRCATCIAASLLLGGCVYYNSIYNAQQAYEHAESLRRAGQDSAAAARYQDVIRGAADGYRRDPDGQWAAEALYLLGRARLRSGDPHAARSSLEAAAALAEDEQTAMSISVYRALAAERLGERGLALELVNRALRTLEPGPALADGHLLRARLLLSAGEVDAGWWDLDRASAVDRNTAVEASLERLAWAVHHRERGRAEEAVIRLLGASGGAARLDSLATLVRGAAAAWGPGVAADLLQASDSAAWGRTGRARAMLLRAELLDAADDTASAHAVARSVARGIGEGAAEARLWLARSALSRTRSLADLDAVRALLLPSGEHPRVEALLRAIEDVAAYASLGLDEPLGWFAAAELARDDLGALPLARGLFLAYADARPGEPWAAKAILAALSVSPDEGDRAWLRGRLEAHRGSPYVLAAFGGAAPGFEALEEDLAGRLRDLKNR